MRMPFRDNAAALEGTLFLTQNRDKISESD
jgi:hypothetical protein